MRWRWRWTRRRKKRKKERDKDIKSQKKPSVPKPVIPEKKDGVLKPGNSAPGFQASGPTCVTDGWWMVVDGGWVPKRFSDFAQNFVR